MEDPLFAGSVQLRSIWLSSTTVRVSTGASGPPASVRALRVADHWPSPLLLPARMR